MLSENYIFPEILLYSSVIWFAIRVDV